jgi:hypothetical protein
MGEHWSLNSVADSENVGYAGLPMIVNVNQATLVRCYVSVLETETAGESVSSNGDEANINFEFGRGTILGAFKVELYAVLSTVDTRGDLGAHLKLHTLLLEAVVESLSNLNVKEWADAVGVLDYSHLGA